MKFEVITVALTELSQTPYSMGVEDFGVMRMGVEDFGVMRMGVEDFGVMRMGVEDFGVMTPTLGKAA